MNLRDYILSVEAKPLASALVNGLITIKNNHLVSQASNLEGLSYLMNNLIASIKNKYNSLESVTSLLTNTHDLGRYVVSKNVNKNISTFDANNLLSTGNGFILGFNPDGPGYLCIYKDGSEIKLKGFGSGNDMPNIIDKELFDKYVNNGSFIIVEKKPSLKSVTSNELVKAAYKREGCEKRKN